MSERSGGWTMASKQQEKTKREGRAMAKVKSCKAEQIWPLWADFCGLGRWFPNLASCSLVEGVAGNEVGSVRHCVGKVVGEGREALWAKERLVEMKHEKRLMRYMVVENNIGLKGYLAAIRVYDAEVEGGCMVEWRFEADAVEEGFQGYMQSSLDSIVKKMEEAVRLSSLS